MVSIMVHCPKNFSQVLFWTLGGQCSLMEHPLTSCTMFKIKDLRWLNTVSSTYIWMGHYNHSLSLDATIMVSKNCLIIGEYVIISLTL